MAKSRHISLGKKFAKATRVSVWTHQTQIALDVSVGAASGLPGTGPDATPSHGARPAPSFFGQLINLNCLVLKFGCH
jgi:hypothetical protein